MAGQDVWLQQVSDAHARGDTHAVKWLTACWMPYPVSVREAARSGPQPEAPAPTGPFKTGKIVFHASTKRANDATTLAVNDPPTE